MMKAKVPCRFASVICCVGLLGIADAQPNDANEPLVRVVDLNLGETQSVRLCNGEVVSVKLISLDEQRDPIRHAVRQAQVKVQVDNETAELISATYRLPKKIGKVQIDCSITRGYNTNGSPESWALDKDARLRLWPLDSPLLTAGDEVVLDGSRSWSHSGAITSYQWQFDDGKRAEGPQVTRAYPRPGCYSEALKVTDAEGNVAFDFAVVQESDYGPIRFHTSSERLRFRVRKSEEDNHQFRPWRCCTCLLHLNPTARCG